MIRLRDVKVDRDLNDMAIKSKYGFGVVDGLKFQFDNGYTASMVFGHGDHALSSEDTIYLLRSLADRIEKEISDV